MRRVVVLALAACVLLPAGVAPAGRGTAVGIGLSEWEVSVYRTKVPLGKVRFNITNLGEDGHDFVVRGPAGRTIKAVPEIPAGTQLTVAARLGKKGRYVLLCTLPGHEDLGMKSSLKVTKRR